MARRNPWMKVLIGLVAVVALGWLFLRTVRDARSAPYTARAADMRGWEIAEGPGEPDGALVGLRPPSALTTDLFKQIFARNMESLSSPAAAMAPIILRREAAALGDVQADAVVAAARASGLESAPIAIRCLAVRRAEPPASYDYYFLVFEPEPFSEARTRMRAALGTGAAGFDPSALVPSLVIATSDPAVRHVVPFQPDPDRDCVAPVMLE